MTLALDSDVDVDVQVFLGNHSSGSEWKLLESAGASCFRR